MKPYKPGPKANSGQSQDAIIVIDDVQERAVCFILIESYLHQAPSIKPKESNTLGGEVKFSPSLPLVQDDNSRQFSENSFDKKIKKRKLDDQEALVINVENNNPSDKKPPELEIKNRYAGRDRVYKTYFSDVDPIEYFINNNPGKVYEDVLKLKLNHKKNPENNDLNEEDQEAIVNMLKEFYEEKSEQYNLCTCQYCAHLTLPFMIKKDVTDPKEIHELQQKHAEYYTKHFPETNTNQPGNQIKEQNNIFYKKVQLGEIKCKWTN